MIFSSELLDRWPGQYTFAFPLWQDCYVLSCGVFLEKHLPYLPEEFISRKPSPFSFWELWVCMKCHCKTVLPQPNVIWHTRFWEPAIPCPGQEWSNIKRNYETRMRQVFPFVPSAALLVFALMLNGCLAQLGAPVRYLQEGNVLPAFSALYFSQLCWADHSWKLGDLLHVTDPFALRSGCRDPHGPDKAHHGKCYKR